MSYRHTIHLHDDYLDGELSPPEVERVDEHIAACEACRRQFDQLKKTRDLVGGITVTDPGRLYFDDLAERIGERTTVIDDSTPRYERPARPESSGTRTLKVLIRLAAAITLLFGSFYISDINDSSRQPLQPGNMAQSADDSIPAQFGTETILQPEAGLVPVGAPPPASDSSADESKVNATEPNEVE